MVWVIIRWLPGSVTVTLSGKNLCSKQKHVKNKTSIVNGNELVLVTVTLGFLVL